MYFAATEVITGLAWLVERNTGFPLWTIVFSPPIHVPNWMDAIRTIMLGAAVPLFLLLLRVLPLSGYHAAEHQVVHAIERGEPLSPETVQALPRVHPRCGTNIVAAALVFLSLVRVLSSEAATIIVIFVMVFAWRMIGAYFQYYITTKPPSSKQLKSGIQAGASLLDKYRNNPA
ncbi:MAG: DUF1385 domain-containing protein, partial [Anaerolineae bacterium]|nr:DUF1385 domain-containing protein [Anaerolineae bacterium]